MMESNGHETSSGKCASDAPIQRRGSALNVALSGKRLAIQKIVRDDLSSDRFPAEIIDILRRLGALVAPLPSVEGGMGWGTQDSAIPELCAGLQTLGYGSLAGGRIYEAHVNAMTLIFRYGHTRVKKSAAAAVRSGHLFGLWVAPGSTPVRISRSGLVLRLVGTKPFCTAAGFTDRAVITALDEDGNERMVLVDTSDAILGGSALSSLHGMRSTSTRAASFDCEVSIEQCFGDAGDYIREPEFSVGAWRTSAITVGGLQALVDETIVQLRERGRHTDPHQAARIGQMLIKLHTAATWATAAANRVNSHRDDPQQLTAFVNLARVAVEQACLEVVPLVQRSLGLASLIVTNPVESLMRDIVTYLRQPAGDEALCEAAVTFAQSPRPSALSDTP